MSRHIPADRWAAFATVAGASMTKKVLIACRSRAVCRQYEGAIAALGGKPENLVFRVLGEPPESEVPGA
jgi:hypothetical protein